MDWALTNGYAVFTHDLDFGTLLALTHATGPSDSDVPRRVTRHRVELRAVHLESIQRRTGRDPQHRLSFLAELQNLRRLQLHLLEQRDSPRRSNRPHGRCYDGPEPPGRRPGLRVEPPAADFPPKRFLGTRGSIWGRGEVVICLCSLLPWLEKGTKLELPLDSLRTS